MLLFYLTIFLNSLFIIGNPLRLYYLYKNDKNYEIKMKTTLYVYNINNILPDSYNLSEKNHFYDVRIIIRKFYFLTIICNIFFDYISQSILIILFFILINILILVNFKNNFDKLWNKLHYLFFKNNSWLFPRNSLIIKLFPLNFWKRLFIEVIFIFYLRIIFYYFII